MSENTYYTFEYTQCQSIIDILKLCYYKQYNGLNIYCSIPFSYLQYNTILVQIFQICCEHTKPDKNLSNSLDVIRF